MRVLGRPPPTEEQKDEARLLLECGAHPTDVSKVLQINKAHVDAIVRQYGIRTTSIPMMELLELLERIRHLKKKGGTV
jgi:hypothetical protein